MYTFDSRYPPLLKDHEKILEIPQDSLQQHIASTEWDEKS